MVECEMMACNIEKHKRVTTMDIKVLQQHMQWKLKNTLINKNQKATKAEAKTEMPTSIEDSGTGKCQYHKAIDNTISLQ